jgi:hypothetical protein
MDLTSRLNSMKSKINGIEKAKNSWVTNTTHSLSAPMLIRKILSFYSVKLNLWKNKTLT